MADKQDPSSKGTPSYPGAQGVVLTPHPLVARILQDSGEPRETVVVVGFLGAHRSERFGSHLP